MHASIPQNLQTYLALRANPPKPRISESAAREIALLETTSILIRRAGRPFSPSLRNAAKRDLKRRFELAPTPEVADRLAAQLGDWDDTVEERFKKYRRDASQKACAAALLVQVELERELAVARDYRAKVAAVDLRDLALDSSAALREVGALIHRLENGMRLCDAVLFGGEQDMTPAGLAEPLGFDYAAACLIHGIERPEPAGEFGELKGTAAEITEHWDRQPPEAKHSAEALRAMAREKARESVPAPTPAPVVRTYKNGIVEEAE